METITLIFICTTLFITIALIIQISKCQDLKDKNSNLELSLQNAKAWYWDEISRLNKIEQKYMRMITRPREKGKFVKSIKEK